ncbi:hypothetical protein [Cupriavidus basilensis]|uniref:hypothetical protein n=1 Tax=Cupriavidus basilensis TaxID=68895 RepID=UPI00044AE9C0|nr:hypothetical protein [Cupriavidus basilensis]MDF3881267.1 hypothetical protein [Cupriavidus basilensis]
MNISLDELRDAPVAALYRLYLLLPFADLRQGRVIELRATQAVIEDLATRRRGTIPYAAIVPSATSTASQPEPAPTPPPRVRREQFLLGDSVGFFDRHLCERIGTIVRLNQKSASIACNDTDGHWRVSYGLLRRIVDI